MTMDFNKYVGIPWICGEATEKGADCWGIVVMVLADYARANISHYKLTGINSPAKAVDTFEKEIPNELNTGKWKQTSRPQPLDVIMMLSKKTGRPEHVGIYIGDGQILHSLTRENGISEIHPVKLISKLFKELEYYRYVG